MNDNKNPHSKARLLVAVALPLVALGVLVALSSSASATVQGSHDPASASPIVYDTVGSFYGLRNQTNSLIEPIRGYLASSSQIHNDYYKIDLPRGKVLDVRLQTLSPSYVPFGNGQRVSPDFELFTYAGLPGPDTMIDWNIAPFTNRVWQENNILTPVSPSATYYINVSIWYGQGQYNLFITVSDPTAVTGGDYTGNMDEESQNPNNQNLNRDGDTWWFRFSAVHDTNAQVFQEASGWLDITNWNTLDPTERDIIIRIFAEDTGYAPGNPIGKPIEKSEAPNRKIEPFNVLAPYTGTYYIMLRLSNESSAAFTLHFNLTNIPRMPAGGLFGVHKERTYDDTDWYWFNMSKGAGSVPADRVVFNLSEQSDDPLKPVNLNLWLFGYRDYFKPGGSTTDFDILNSSFEADAPYNLTQNPEPRYEATAAIAMYTGIYFIEVEDYNNTGNYTLIQAFDTSPNRQASDFNNEPSQAPVTDWGQYKLLNISQSEDHTDFYKLSAKAGETIEVTYDMPHRSAPDNSVTNQSMGLIWIGIYQPGMQLLAWGWNYHFDYANNQPTDYLDSFATARATVAADGDYIIEVTAMQDGYIGPFTIPGTMPPRTLQVFWHMDWNFATTYTACISRLPLYNCKDEVPTVAALLPDVTLNEGEKSEGVYSLTSYFYDPDVLQGDTLNYTFTFSGVQNLTISESLGLVTIKPRVDLNATPPIDNTDWYGTNTVQVRATDTTKNYAAQYWNITYLPVNDPPYVVTDTPIRFAEDAGVVIVPLINVIRDVDGDALQFQQVPDAGITLSFTATTLRIQTAPDFQTTSLGAPYSTFVDVNDGTTTVRLELRFIVDNSIDAPRVIPGPRNVSCDEDVACPLLNLNTVFYDPDDPQHLKPLAFQVSGNGEIAFDIFNGSLLLKPPADWSGAKTIQVIAIKYTTSGSITTPWPSVPVELNLIVREINDPPRVLSWNPPPRPVTVQEGASKSFSVDAEDPEHLQPTFRWYLDEVSVDNTLPSYAFVPSYSTSHPGANATMTLKVVIADGAGGEEIHEWDVTVIDVPRMPQVTIASPLEGNRGYERGKPVHFFASAFDPDGDVLTFAWTVDTTGQQILDQPEGDVSFDQVGNVRVRLVVSDGVSVVPLTVNVTISEPKKQSPGFDTPVVVGAFGALAAVAAVASRRRRVD